MVGIKQQGQDQSTTTTTTMVEKKNHLNMAKHLLIRSVGGGKDSEKKAKSCPANDENATPSPIKTTPKSSDGSINNKGLQPAIVTPSIVKRKKLSRWFNSPTDHVLSPCSQKLWKKKGNTKVDQIITTKIIIHDDELPSRIYTNEKLV